MQITITVDSSGNVNVIPPAPLLARGDAVSWAVQGSNNVTVSFADPTPINAVNPLPVPGDFAILLEAILGEHPYTVSVNGNPAPAVPEIIVD